MGGKAPLAPSPGCATDCVLKNLECSLKKQKQLVLKSFYVSFQVIIINEVPVAILWAYILIPRHNRKILLISRIFASHYCTAVGGQQFHKESRKLQTRIMFERYCSIFHYCLLFCRYVMFQKFK